MTCRKCNESKPESEFHKRSNGVYYYQCKECKRAYDRERHYRMSENIEWRIKRSERNKKRYHENTIRTITTAPQG